MDAPRQTFLVHVMDGGPQAVVEDVTSRERIRVADVHDVGERIAALVGKRAANEVEDS